MEIYLVGGAVRDRLLGLPVKDRDWVVVGSTPGEMESLGYQAVGKDFPVFLHPQTREEYALARTERKTAPGYKGFHFNASAEVTLEDDLRRRDLTINAIAENENGELIDPFHGVADLQAGIFRHVSAAFSEDPLRVLRVARFAARFGFTIADETRRLLQEISQSGELDALIPERTWTEVERALGEPAPVNFFNVLRECYALGPIFPEIHQLFGVPQPAEHHPEIDSGVHTMMVLEQACKLSKDPLVRFAALVHDLGKGVTPEEAWPRHHGHEEKGVGLVNKLCERLKIPSKYRELAIITARHHLHCHRIEELTANTILKKLQQLDALRRPERFAQFLLACEADARGRTGFEKRAYPQARIFLEYLSAVNSINTEGLEGEGKQIGKEITKRRLLAISAYQTKRHNKTVPSNKR